MAPARLQQTQNAHTTAHCSGRQGATKASIERDTGTRINVPSARPTAGGRAGAADEPVQINIRGSSAAAVASARTRIDIIVHGAVQAMDYTHFFSLPLGGAAEAFDRWRRRVLSDAESSATGAIGELCEEVFVSGRQLHVTLLMLKLPDAAAVDVAATLLRDAASDVQAILAPHLSASRGAGATGSGAAATGVPVAVKGLEYMNDDPSAVHVLYGKIAAAGPAKPSGGDVLRALEEVCKALVQRAIDAGLVDDDELRRQHMLASDGTVSPKLHVTLINSRLRRTSATAATGAAAAGSAQTKRGLDAASRRSQYEMYGDDEADASNAVAGFNSGDSNRFSNRAARVPIDARTLLTTHRQDEVATAMVREVHLSVRGPFAADGYYRAAARIPVALSAASAASGDG